MGWPVLIFLALLSKCWTLSERATSTILKSLIWLCHRSRPQPRCHKVDPLPIELWTGVTCKRENYVIPHFLEKKSILSRVCLTADWLLPYLRRMTHHIYSKYWNTLSPYHTVLLFMCLKQSWFGGKQCGSQSDAPVCSIWSGSTLFT